MEWKKTTCYLCGQQAEELLVDRNLRVKCINCNTFYELSSAVQKWRLDKMKNQLLYESPSTGEKAHLTDSQIQRLLEFIRRKEDPKGREPVVIAINIIDGLSK